jgi:hypothetical protein
VGVFGRSFSNETEETEAMEDEYFIYILYYTLLFPRLSTYSV